MKKKRKRKEQKKKRGGSRKASRTITICFTLWKKIGNISPTDSIILSPLFLYLLSFVCHMVLPGSERSPGVGTGNPLQYSCLKNPTDRGTQQATIHGVAKSRTWLRDFTFSQSIVPLPFGYLSRPFPFSAHNSSE